MILPPKFQSKYDREKQRDEGKRKNTYERREIDRLKSYQQRFLTDRDFAITVARQYGYVFDDEILFITKEDAEPEK